MSNDLEPSLKRLGLQIALQLPDDQKEAVSILQYVREIVERDPKKGHGLRTSGKRGPSAERATVVGSDR